MMYYISEHGITYLTDFHIIYLVILAIP